MIDSFNRRQLLRVVLALVGGLIATAITLAFFWFGLGFVLNAFSLESLAPWLPGIVAIVMLAIFASGFGLWRRGHGEQDFLDSNFIGGLGYQTGGAAYVTLETRELRGASYLLSQVALAAPLQFLKAFDLFRSRIPSSPERETELKELLEEIRQHQRWLPISEFSDRSLQVGYLVRMEKVDFSPRKGTIKA